jgi:hypothetical protein
MMTMIDLAVQMHGLDPRDVLEVELRVNGNGEVRITTPRALVHFDIDVDRLRHLLLMLDSMLEDYDRITLGFDRLADAVETEPL